MLRQTRTLRKVCHTYMRTCDDEISSFKMLIGSVLSYFSPFFLKSTSIALPLLSNPSLADLARSFKYESPPFCLQILELIFLRLLHSITLLSLIFSTLLEIFSARLMEFVR